MLKNVKFVDRKTNPDKNLIRYATAVWIQSNAISHKDYYKIVDIARTAGIKYEYFSYASAEKCAEQLALYDMGMS